MNRARIISALILLAILGAFAAVYQFYLKEKLETYARDQELRQSLEQTYNDLYSTFEGYKPELVTSAWRAQTTPWEEAVEQRTGYFNLGDWPEHESPPEDVPILRFWYGEQANQMVTDTYQRMLEELGYGNFPPDLYTTLGVPHSEQWAGLTVERPVVEKALTKLSFGISAIEMLLEAGAVSISEVVVWPPAEYTEDQKLITRRTVGLSFAMTLSDLVDFLEELRVSERFFTVDALKLDWPYIAYETEPQIQVSMLLTQANFTQQELPDAPAGDAGNGAVQAQTAQQLFQLEGLDRRSRRESQGAEPVQRGFFQRAMRWLAGLYGF